jgi:hypothetical protein
MASKPIQRQCEHDKSIDWSSNGFALVEKLSVELSSNIYILITTYGWSDHYSIMCTLTLFNFCEIHEWEGKTSHDVCNHCGYPLFPVICRRLRLHFFAFYFFCILFCLISFHFASNLMLRIASLPNTNCIGVAFLFEGMSLVTVSIKVFPFLKVHHLSLLVFKCSRSLSFRHMIFVIVFQT